LGDTLLKVKGFDLDGGIRRLFSLTDQAAKFVWAGRAETDGVLGRGTAYSFEKSKKHGDSMGLAAEAIRFSANYEINFTAFHKNLFDRLGLTSRHSWEELDLEFLKISHLFDREEGVIGIVKLLKENNIRMGVVSNSFHGGKSLEWMLEQAGIKDYFEFLISSADYGFRKPHPEIFETAIARLGVDREKVWFVGDKPEADIAGAKNAGITAIWYNADNEPPCQPEPDMTVTNWADFAQIICRLHN